MAIDRNVAADSQMHPLLKALAEAAPIFQKLYPADTMIAIADTEKFVYYLPGRDLNAGHIVGRVVPKEDAIHVAMRSGKMEVMNNPKEILGMEFKAIAIPLFNESRVLIGGIGLGLSLVNNNNLEDVIRESIASSKLIADKAAGLSLNSQEINVQQNILYNLGKEVLDQVRKTDDILRFINGVASNSNLLGLNAAIEASRAGENGKGFSVVAAEIRKMAVDSGKAVGEIKNILTTINDRVTSITNQIDITTHIGEAQQEVIEQITKVSNDLNRLVQSMIKAEQHR